MIHGYCRKTDDGEIVLGFTDSAPVFKLLAEGKPTHKLVQAAHGAEVVGYTVVRDGEGHGFLWAANERQRAEDEAMAFAEMFDHQYNILPLRIQDED